MYKYNNVVSAIKHHCIVHSFKDDYSEGAHPRILDALLRTNSVQQEGYGLDRYSLEASELIRKAIGQDQAVIHFATGGTQTNLLVLSAILKPYESVIAPESAHIAVHEAGAIEASGHKIHTLPSEDGKLSSDQIQTILDVHVDEHMVVPRAVFVSHPTEYGTLYSKAELQALSTYCQQNNLLLYLDGARLAMALASPHNDLSLETLSKGVDVFYIGGTKTGGLLGEAIVFTNPALSDHFRYHMKQKGALIAKGRTIGIQFAEMFRDGLYLELGRIANERAAALAEGIQKAGYQFWIPPATNQIFPVFPDSIVKRLKERYDFYEWTSPAKGSTSIRLVTSWATPVNAVDQFLEDLNSFSGKS